MTDFPAHEPWMRVALTQGRAVTAEQARAALDEITALRERLAAAMTPADAADRVQQISHLRLDPEKAHMAEDQMRDEVLRAIADGAREPAALAAAALVSSGLDFERWTG